MRFKSNWRDRFRRKPSPYSSKKQWGPDTIDNLITLCLPCHATKIRKHRQLIEKSGSKFNAQFLKWALWEIGLNLTYSGFNINVRNFPKSKITKTLKSTIQTCEVLKSLIDSIDTDGELLNNTDLKELIKSIKIAHKSHEVQSVLDKIIFNSMSGSI